jgi:hypothetical protein
MPIENFLEKCRQVMWLKHLSYRLLYRDVLHLELPDIEHVERAQRPARLPEVFTREEARAVLSHTEGTPRLMASLLYGSGLRLMEGFHGPPLRHHPPPPPRRRRAAASRARCHPPGRNREEGVLPHVPPLVLHALAGGWLRQPHGEGSSRLQGRQDDHGLRPRLEPGGRGVRSPLDSE